jgi:hypothetical protein
MRFFDWLRRNHDGAPRLKNKAGGMAWVKGGLLHAGAEALGGAAVKTLSVDARGMWRIEPHLGYIATANQRFPDGTVYLRGEAVVVCGLHDSALEPWKEDGISESEVTALFAPQLTTGEAA